MGTLVPHYYQHEDQIPYMTYKIYRNDNIYYKIDPQTYFPALCPMALLPSNPQSHYVLFHHTELLPDL